MMVLCWGLLILAGVLSGIAAVHFANFFYALLRDIYFGDDNEE